MFVPSFPKTILIHCSSFFLEPITGNAAFKNIHYLTPNHNSPIDFLLLPLLDTEYGFFPGDSVVKNLPANAGDVCLIPGLGRPPGEGPGHPLQYSCLGNPTDRDDW